MPSFKTWKREGKETSAQFDNVREWCRENEIPFNRLANQIIIAMSAYIDTIKTLKMKPPLLPPEIVLHVKTPPKKGDWRYR